MTLQITPIPAFEDNYIWAIHNHEYAVLVDPGEAAPALNFLKNKNLELSGILITHHHYDHINGVEELLSLFPCEVYAPDDQRIPFNHHVVKESDRVQLPKLNLEFHVLETPGHTLSHICYFNHEWLFCGDTLFSMGCGRMFEGTPNQFVSSLNKLRDLPGSLKVYCTHEYTLSNLAFALSVEPNNQAMLNFHKKVTDMRQENKPSLPTLLQLEKSLNPFLRTDDVKIQNIISKKSQAKINSETDCFAQMRQLKDIF